MYVWRSDGRSKEVVKWKLCFEVENEVDDDGSTLAVSVSTTELLSVIEDIFIAELAECVNNDEDI